MESANNDARKWPILPFDVSRDFKNFSPSSRISRNFSLDNFLSIRSVYANLESTEINRKIPKYNCNIRKISKEIQQYIYIYIYNKVGVDYINKSKVLQGRYI